MAVFVKDLHYLLTTAKDAAKVLRHNTEYFEAQGKDAKAERDAVRWLNLAIQLVERDLDDTEQQPAAAKERVKL
jgi:hypothetical protein